MRSQRPPRVWFLRALPTILCLGFAGCSKLGIYVEEEGEKPPPPPVVLEKFVWHRYDNGREMQRIAGDVAYYYEKESRMEVHNINAYFYDEKDPFGKMSVLNSGKAMLYLADSPTTPPAFLSGDIDFADDVSFIHRGGYWVQSASMRYHKKERELTSDGPTTRVLAVENAVWIDTGNGGFVFNLHDYSFQMNRSETAILGGAEGQSLRESLKKKIAAVEWIGPTDDQSIALRNGEQKP